MLEAIAQGDEKAFAELVREYSQPIFGISMAYTKSREGAEEVVQDVLLKVWANRSRLTGLDNFESWLFVITRNRVLNAMRDRLAGSGALVLEEEYGVEELTPYHTTEARDRYQQLLRGIETLPEKRKLVFKMSRLQGKTHKEIAAELGIHEITVAQYIVKALSTLREYLQAHGTDSILLIILLQGYTQ